MTEFLPPVVLKLGADISEYTAKLAEAAAQLQAFINSVPTTLAQAKAPAGAEGEQAGKSYSDRFTESTRGLGERVGRDVSGRLRDSRGRFIAAGQSLGHDFNTGVEQATKSGFLAALRAGTSLKDVKNLFSGISESFTSIGIAVVTAVSPIIAAGIGGAIIAGVGAGTIGLGAVILHNSPPIVAAAKQLKNDVTKVFKDAASPLQGPFVESLHLLDSAAKALGPQFKQMFAAVAPAVVPLTKGIVGLITNAMPGLVAVSKAAAPFLTQLAKDMPGLGKDISAFLTTVAKNGPVALHIFESVLGIIEGVLGILNVLLNIAGGMYAVFTAVEKFVDKIPPAVSKAASAVGGFFSDLGSKIAGWATAAWDKVSGFFSKVGSAVGGFISDTGSKIGDFFTKTIPGWLAAAGKFFTDLPGKIRDGLAALPGVLAHAASSAFDKFFFAIGYGVGSAIKEMMRLPGQIKNIVTTTFTATERLVSTGIDKTVSFFKALPGRVATFLTQLYNGVTSAISDLWTAVTTAVANGVTAAVDWVKQLPGKVLDLFTKTKDNATSTTSKMISSVVGFFESLPGKALDQVKKLASQIKGFFSDAGQWLYQAGKDIVHGLIHGIEDTIGDAIRTVKRAMGDIVKGARHALDSHSPSRVFAAIGSDTVAGFIQGVNANAASAAAAVANLLSFGTTGSLGDLGIVGAGVVAPPGVTTPVAAAQTTTINLVNELTLLIDGKRLHAQLIGPAQQYKLRTGTTGLT